MSDAFELTPYEQLPLNEQLTSLDDLVGHTIRAVFDRPSNNEGLIDADLVFVTESGSWLAIKAEGGDSCGESPDWDVIGKRFKPPAWTVHDFVSAAHLYQGGVINSGERDLLVEKEAAIRAKRDQAKADRLRAELAKLEAPNVQPRLEP